MPVGFSPRRQIGLALALLGWLTAMPVVAETVKVAAVHFEPVDGDVEQNLSRLVQLTVEAAEHGAKIVVHTEMATSGYSFFSRAQVATVAEPIPGPSTRAIAAVARRYGIYVAFGLPEYDRATNLYYNSVALIGPRGHVVGVYRKRNNLLEASYNSEVWAPVQTYDTPYGRLAIVICADMFYDAFPRLAAIAGANILLAPANVGITTDFMKVRAWENDFSVIVANRFGHGGKGTKPVFFNQDTFTIPSPFDYDYSGSVTAIISSKEEVLASLSAPKIAIAYADLPIRRSRTLPVVRRPSLYPLLAQDTLESYTLAQFGLPAAARLSVAAVDPGPQADPWAAALAAARSALATVTDVSAPLRLIIFPADYFREPQSDGMTSLKSFAVANKVDLVLHFGADVPPRSVMIASNGETYQYSRTHRLRGEKIAKDKLGSHYAVVDRDYARIALLQDVDLMAPETSMMMEKLGVDIVALNSDNNLSVASALWSSRVGDYYNIVTANKSGVEGVYLGGYPPGPQSVEREGLAVSALETKYVRSKKEPRFLDFTALLKPCGPSNC